MPKLRVIIKPPPEPQGEPEQQVEALRDYLLQMSEELAYVLTHLEADNINDSTFERIQSMIPRPYTGLPVMDGDASSGQSEQWSRGDHRHGHDSTKADVTALATETAAREAHEADTGNPHEVTAAQVGLGNVANERQYSAQNPPPIPTPGDVGAIPVTEKGSANGVAELDSNGHVPSSQLPSYVDDVKEYPSVTDFPIPGESDKIYIALDTDLFYRWGGTVYAPTNPSLALGETSSTAYRGDRGKIAYDHSQVTSGNPHNVSASDVGLGNVANERQYSAQNPPPLPTPADIGAATAQDLTDHVGDTNNPHGVTAAQVGLGNVDNVRQYSASNPPPAPDAEDVPYDNTGSGLMATDVQSAIDEIAQGGGGGGTAASAVSYDNTGSGLAATNVQDAIDEVYGDIPSQPSDIGAQEEIAAFGILKGDGQGGVSAATPGTDYQAPLTIDPTPTANSTNPVQSGGVYTDVRTRVPNYGKGKNLLNNSYFVGGGTGHGVFPVNQRGATTLNVGSKYFIDGWVTRNTTGSVALSSSGLSVTTPSGLGARFALLQYIKLSDYIGQTLTLSVLNSENLYSASVDSLSITGTNTRAILVSMDDGGLAELYVSTSGCYISLSSGIGKTSTFKAAKLELGTEQTLAHQENSAWVLNEIPDYEEELIKCQTSTADPSDTYANKSLATEQQLAYVETGTTASRAYSVGEYFCLNGLLYLVTAAISSGGTFIPGTNCKQVTDGGINAIAPKQLLNERITGAGNYSVPSLRSYNLFIVQVLGNSLNFRTLVIPPGVSTQINVDATASIYAHVTMIIELTNNRVSVTSFNSAAWNQAMLRVWGVSLPV